MNGTALRKPTARRVVGMVAGIVIIALGIALFKQSHLGNDSISALNMRLAELLGGGTPVLSSSGGSLPEVLGNAACVMAGFDADVYVADSHVRYLAPVYGDLSAQAQAVDEADWDTFLATFAQRGKARIEVLARQPGEAGKPAAELSGRYVAFARM